MVSIKDFSKFYPARELMDRIHIGGYVVFDTSEVAKVVDKCKITNTVWRLKFDRPVSKYNDGDCPENEDLFHYTGYRAYRGHTVLDYRNNICRLMDESEYKSYMAAVKEEEEEKLKRKRWLEEQEKGKRMSILLKKTRDLEKENANLDCMLEMCNGRIDKLEAENARLREALEFYALGKHLLKASGVVYDAYDIVSGQVENGKYAQEVLEGCAK